MGSSVIRGLLWRRLRQPRVSLHPIASRSLHGSPAVQTPPSLGSEVSMSQATQDSSRPAQSAASKKQSSINPDEVAKFTAMADMWWDLKGPHRELHAMNPIRISFLRAAICRHLRLDRRSAKPLLNLRVLDVGCGGGLLCEPLARMGADVTGVDASEANIRVAALHAGQDPATKNINYVFGAAEQLADSGESFDIVTSLEVIEHVAEPLEFCKTLGELCRPGGGVVVSTLNRTMRSYGLAVAAAEYVLRMLPPGTHEWSKFVTPQEMALLLRQSGLKMDEMAGMVFNPFTGRWGLSDDINVNYIAYAVKPT